MTVFVRVEWVKDLGYNSKLDPNGHRRTSETVSEGDRMDDSVS